MTMTVKKFFGKSSYTRLMTTRRSMIMMYNVIAKCTDGDLMIGKDGIYEFNLEEAKEIADAHKTLGAEIIIVTAK